MNRAYFVQFPAQMWQLQKPHLITQERPYEIAITITIPWIDYENFSEGMDVEREYLEKVAGMRSLGDVYHCVLVKSKRGDNGILVVPDAGGFVLAAAYYAGK